MNEDLEIFLSYYKPEETSPGVYTGGFVTTSKEQSNLYKLRDILTNETWLEIAQAAQPGYDLLPNNLRQSLNVKFREFEIFIEENAMHGMTIPEILQSKIKYTEAQRLIWGVLSSAVECVYFHQIKTAQSESIFEYK